MRAQGLVPTVIAYNASVSARAKGHERRSGPPYALHGTEDKKQKKGGQARRRSQTPARSASSQGIGQSSWRHGRADGGRTRWRERGRSSLPRETTLGVRSGLSLTHADLGQSLDTPGDGWFGGRLRQAVRRLNGGGRTGKTEVHGP